MQANFSQSVENLVFLTHLVFCQIAAIGSTWLSHDTLNEASQELGVPKFLKNRMVSRPQRPEMSSSISTFFSLEKSKPVSNN